MRFQRKKRNLLLPHYRVQIRPRRIDPLAPYIIPPVKHIIQYLDSQMGHANFIDVRKTHGKPDVHFRLILICRVYFIADVAGRLFDF